MIREYTDAPKDIADAIENSIPLKDDDSLDPNMPQELKEIDDLANEVFGGDEEEKTKWFANNKIFGLNNEVPDDLMLTKEGRYRVRNMLGAILHGFCA